MSATIIRLNGHKAYNLIYPDHLSMLSTIEQETMYRSMSNSSHVWLGTDDDLILAVWGLIPPTLMSDIAYLWLFTTKHLPSRRFMFARHSRQVIAQMLDTFPTIVGHCTISNHRAQQWLRWLGAEFGEPINGLAVPFTIKAQQ